MEPRILNPGKALRTLRKTALLVQGALADLDQGTATTRRDGPEGWSILQIACHLRDYERIVARRIELLLMENDPELPAIDNVAAERTGDYMHQSIAIVRDDLRAGRAALLDRLVALDADDWARVGHHPQQGGGTLLDVAINTGLHDIDHLEQIAGCREGGR